MGSEGGIARGRLGALMAGPRTAIAVAAAAPTAPPITPGIGIGIGGGGNGTPYPGGGGRGKFIEKFGKKERGCAPSVLSPNDRSLEFKVGTHASSLMD